MSTNKISHLKEWENIYVPLRRSIHPLDGVSKHGENLCFRNYNDNCVWVNDSDSFVTLEELKEQLANDGMPKQGELEFWDEVEVSLDWEKWYSRDDTTYQFTFISKVKDKYIISKANNIIDKFEKELYVDWIRFYKYCRKHTKKTELTLAEIEEKLGLETGSLIIK